MWSEDRLAADLQEIGLRDGLSVLVHTSLRSIGSIEGGGETLLNAFRRVLGPTGTLMVPTFNFDSIDPMNWQHPPVEAEELERLRQMASCFDIDQTPADPHCVGFFPEIVRRQPDACRSDHPMVSFAAVGANAEFLTQGIPFHFPLGSESPPARLHQLNGVILLIGVDHRANSSLHLAEVWANMPYIHRSVQIKTCSDQWSEMKGSPECSEGFSRIEPLLRQSRVTRQAYLGNAVCQLMQARPLISMAISLLKGDGSALLCDRLDCRWCVPARNATREVDDGGVEQV